MNTNEIKRTKWFIFAHILLILPVNSNHISTNAVIMLNYNKGKVLNVDKILRNTNCPPGFQELSTGCYYFSNFKTTWRRARLICRTLKADLAAIETEEEMQVLKEFKNNKNFPHDTVHWLSGSDEFKEDHWIWTSTGRLIGQMKKYLLGMTNSKAAKYLALRQNGMSDYGETASFSFICEF